MAKEFKLTAARVKELEEELNYSLAFILVS